MSSSLEAEFSPRSAAASEHSQHDVEAGVLAHLFQRDACSYLTSCPVKTQIRRCNYGDCLRGPECVPDTVTVLVSIGKEITHSGGSDEGIKEKRNPLLTTAGSSLLETTTSRDQQPHSDVVAVAGAGRGSFTTNAIFSSTVLAKEARSERTT